MIADDLDVYFAFTGKRVSDENILTLAATVNYSTSAPLLTLSSFSWSRKASSFTRSSGDIESVLYSRLLKRISDRYLGGLGA